MHVLSDAILLSVRWHGEHGAIAAALTPAEGMLAGYVRGGRSRRLRPVLVPGNLIRGEWRARVDTQLPALTVDLLHSRAPLLAEPLAAAAIDWATVLTAAVLPEGAAYPAVHEALGGLLDAVEAAPSARGWAVALVRYEQLLLASLGFGLDLSRCAVTEGEDDLAFVSPRSGRAVSIAGAAGHEARLMRLPGFMHSGGEADWSGILDGLRVTGHFLERDLLGDRRGAAALAARMRLLDRLERAAGR